jgi:hypothetical protein
MQPPRGALYYMVRVIFLVAAFTIIGNSDMFNGGTPFENATVRYVVPCVAVDFGRRSMKQYAPLCAVLLFVGGCAPTGDVATPTASESVTDDSPYQTMSARSAVP